MKSDQIVDIFQLGYDEILEFLISDIEMMGLDEKIEAINKIKIRLHESSPFKKEPVDCVLWKKGESVKANDYNPNTVAPPEMALLELSINADGYTQPIVTMKDDNAYEVIDGFHRNRVGKESEEVNARIHGYLPIVAINKERTKKTDRMSSTIRHNRARGKHRVDAMSDIVIELKKRNWSTEKIGKELGMDSDEILRLCQITGLAEVFSDEEFSKAWDIDVFEEDNYGIEEDEENLS